MPLRTPEIMGILLELEFCGRCGGGGGSLKKDFKSYLTMQFPVKP